jgi:hypothetical protein
MADLALSVLISRAGLGLSDLEVNDGYIYKASTQFLGALVSWNRTTITGPSSDGGVTVERQLQMVQEPMAIEVWGRTALDATMRNSTLRVNMNALVAAFWQDNFVITVTEEDAVWAYQCEAADVQVTWNGNRSMAKRGLITFTIPRQPRSLVDGLL